VIEDAGRYRSSITMMWLETSCAASAAQPSDAACEGTYVVPVPAAPPVCVGKRLTEIGPVNGQVAVPAPLRPPLSTPCSGGTGEMDVHSNCIVGYSISDRMASRSAVTANR